MQIPDETGGDLLYAKVSLGKFSLNTIMEAERGERDRRRLAESATATARGPARNLRSDCLLPMTYLRRRPFKRARCFFKWRRSCRSEPFCSSSLF